MIPPYITLRLLKEEKKNCTQDCLLHFSLCCLILLQECATVYTAVTRTTLNNERIVSMNTHTCTHAHTHSISSRCIGSVRFRFDCARKYSNSNSRFFVLTTHKVTFKTISFDVIMIWTLSIDDHLSYRLKNHFIKLRSIFFFCYFLQNQCAWLSTNVEHIHIFCTLNMFRCISIAFKWIVII